MATCFPHPSGGLSLGFGTESSTLSASWNKRHWPGLQDAPGCLTSPCVELFGLSPGNRQERHVGTGAAVNLSIPSLSVLRQKKGTVAHKHWVGPSNLVKCKPCPAAQSPMVCGSDGHTYTSKVGRPSCHWECSASACSDKCLGHSWACESQGLWALPLKSYHMNRVSGQREKIKMLPPM